MPNAATGRALARALVQEGLAACVNRVPGVQSTYIWDGKLCEDEEELLVIKLRAEQLSTLTARLRELHPYDVPEIVALPVAGGNPDYLNWVLETE